MKKLRNLLGFICILAALAPQHFLPDGLGTTFYIAFLAAVILLVALLAKLLCVGSIWLRSAIILFAVCLTATVDWQYAIHFTLSPVDAREAFPFVMFLYVMQALSSICVLFVLVGIGKFQQSRQKRNSLN